MTGYSFKNHERMVGMENKLLVNPVFVKMLYFYENQNFKLYRGNMKSKNDKNL